MSSLMAQLCIPIRLSLFFFFFFFTDTATTEIYTLSLHDALPIFCGQQASVRFRADLACDGHAADRQAHDQRKHIQRSEEHTSELQSRGHLVCRLLLEKKKKNSLHR